MAVGFFLIVILLLFLIVIVPTVSGTFALIPMALYGVAEYSFRLLFAFAGMGVLVAVPLSVLVARRVWRQSPEGQRASPSP